LAATKVAWLVANSAVKRAAKLVDLKAGKKADTKVDSMVDKTAASTAEL